MKNKNTKNIAQGKSSFLEMAESILQVAESGDTVALERKKREFNEAGGQLCDNFRNQGFTEREIISRAYLTDPKYQRINTEEEVKGGNN